MLKAPDNSSSPPKSVSPRAILSFKTMNQLRKSFILVFGLIVAVFHAAAQSPSPALSETPTAPDAAELTRLLHQFLDGASRNQLSVHQNFWADDLIYTSSSGRRLGKADILHDVTA